MPVVVLVSTLAAVVVLADGGAAALTPSRTVVFPLPVQELALTQRSIAFVADVPGRLQCSRIGYWQTRTRQAFTIDSKKLCTEETSTGQGVAGVSVAIDGFLWLTYGGGNIREWSLWTTTRTRRTPRRLRFVARDVDAPAPIVVGQGYYRGIPYAVDREVVYLGADGRAIFKATVPEPVRLIAAGPGGRCEVAVVVESGALYCWGGGDPIVAPGVFPPRSVKALEISLGGVWLQVDRRIVTMRPGRHGPTEGTLLPPGATMVDVGQERILWQRNGDLGATRPGKGRSVRLVDGSPARPVLGQLTSNGLAWAQGRLVRWRADRLPNG